MYRDGGRALSTDEIEEETTEENGAINGTEKGTINGTINVPKKVNKKRTFSSRERAHAHIESIRYENINNIKSNSNGTKKGKKEVKKQEKKQENPTISFSDFWNLYDKMVAEDRCNVLWKQLTDEDHRAIMAYVPQYIAAQPNKRFRKNPEKFLANRAWEDEIIQEQSVQKGRGKKQPTTVLHDSGDDTYDNVEGW